MKRRTLIRLVCLALDRIAALDDATMERVSQARTAMRTTFMQVVTLTPLWLGLLLGGLAALGERTFMVGAVAGGFVAGAASLLVQAIKYSVRRTRPSMAYCIAKTLDRYSFPSGHSATAFAVAMGALFVSPIAFPLMLLLASLVSFSRVYLGVHYPSDVLTGAAMGLLLGTALYAFEFPARAAAYLVG